MPPRNKGSWADKEHQLFIQGLEKFGKKWVKIASVVKTRNATQVKDHYKFLPKDSHLKINTEKRSLNNKQRTSAPGSRRRRATSQRSTKTTPTPRSSSLISTSTMSDSSSEDDDEGRSSTTGLLSGEIELGITSPRQRPSRKRSTSKKRMPSLELEQLPGSVTNSNKIVEEAPDLQGDYWNIALLLLLYTLQGIPMGLTGAVSLVLSANGVSLAQQGMFALVSWPFSLKLLWAPIVDSVFITRFGRRKTWLIPTQLIIAGTIIYAAPHIEAWIAPNAVNGVWNLTIVFFVLFLMCATQDICVDGWALTLLQRRNVGYASTCNAIGQTLGNSLSYIGWIVLDNYTNISFGSFMMMWGVLFGVTTIIIMLFKKEEEPTTDEMPPTYIQAYKEMIQILKIPLVQQLILLLMTCKIAFAPEALSQVMLVGTVGLPKTDWGFLGLLLTVRLYILHLFYYLFRSLPLYPFSL
jgi:PAT family acetyl-CoA transporter-like MFS transporter 1